MKFILNKSISLLLVVCMTVCMISCSGSRPIDPNKATILYPNWAEGIAMTFLAEVALKAHGFEVALISLEPGLIYGDLSKKHPTGDFMLDAWLPHTQSDYWKVYGDKIDIVGNAFDDGSTGLVVPSYVDINSIEELNAHRDEFKGKIIGIGSGAGIHANTEKVIKTYNLNFEQVTSSGSAMVATLEKAILRHEPVVVTGWKPHFMWGQFDLKFLKDPKEVFPKDACSIIARKRLKQDKPRLFSVLTKLNLSEEMLNELMKDVQKDDKIGAKNFYQKHKKTIDAWFD